MLACKIGLFDIEFTNEIVKKSGKHMSYCWRTSKENFGSCQYVNNIRKLSQQKEQRVTIFISRMDKCVIYFSITRAHVKDHLYIDRLLLALVSVFLMETTTVAPRMMHYAYIAIFTFLLI